MVDEPREIPSVPTHGAKGGRKGKQKGRKPKMAIEQVEVEQEEEPPAEPEEETADQAQDPAQREEDRQAKKDASNLFEDVTRAFRAFKDRLYTERLAALTAELQLLSEPTSDSPSIHPEFLRQAACVDARLEKQRAEASALYNYRLRSLRQRALGERSQLHSQYYQRVRDVREEVLCKLGENWYAIQRERRQSHQEKDRDEAFVFKFPAKKSVQLRQQAKYNREVEVLSGMAKYVGFPAAPDIAAVEGEALEGDLRAMKV